VRIHIVEAGGRGGVYQHALALAEALARHGEQVVLHTADDAELEPGPEVRVCRCVRWYRESEGPLRRARILMRWLLRTVPHLARAVRRGEVFHFQGEFKTPIVSLLLLTQRLGGKRVVQSRHNTFSRSDRLADDALFRLDMRVVDAVIVFSEQDALRIEQMGARAFVSPLAQYSPPVDGDAVARWKERWSANGVPVVLFAGQIRQDKRLDLAIEASALIAREHRLAVVGEDKGDLDRCRELAAALGVPVSWTTEYVPLADFVAILAAADVIVCPYERASQSGILALARKVGARTVASDVGGLGELATIAVPPGEARPLAAAIERALTMAPVPDDMEAGLVEAHLRAYGLEPA
jgi:glycosyltransferase involved in cell wall biosynthesis